MFRSRLAPAAIALVACAAVLFAGRTGAGRAAAAADAIPVPPAGATVFSRQMGSDALALGVVPHGRSVLVQASVVSRQRKGVRGLEVTFRVAGTVRHAAPCGPGCYRATFAAPRPRAVDVWVAGRRAMPWHVGLPAAWPPRDASTLVARAARAYRSLDSLSFHETLGSGSPTVVVSDWRIQKPDRVAYQVRGGWAGVVIGLRRWDRAPGAATWKASPQSRLHQPTPFWVAVTDAHVLGYPIYRGHPAVRVSFFDPKSPAWFTLVLDRKTLLPLESDMVTYAHFMHDTYGSFDTTRAIVPPR